MNTDFCPSINASLPQEIITEILTFAGPKNYPNIQLVCRLWEDIVKSHLLKDVMKSYEQEVVLQDLVARANTCFPGPEHFVARIRHVYTETKTQFMALQRVIYPTLSLSLSLSVRDLTNIQHFLKTCVLSGSKGGINNQIFLMF